MADDDGCATALVVVAVLWFLVVAAVVDTLVRPMTHWLTQGAYDRGYMAGYRKARADADRLAEALRAHHEAGCERFDADDEALLVAHDASRRPPPPPTDGEPDW